MDPCNACSATEGYVGIFENYENINFSFYEGILQNDFYKCTYNYLWTHKSLLNTVKNCFLDTLRFFVGLCVFSVQWRKYC